MKSGRNSDDGDQKSAHLCLGQDGRARIGKSLAAHGYEIVSSSGTAKHLEEGGLKVTEVVDMTGLPAILGGRVKTLHPAVMGGILARRGLAQDDEDRKKFSIRLSTLWSARSIPSKRRPKREPTLTSLLIRSTSEESRSLERLQKILPRCSRDVTLQITEASSKNLRGGRNFPLNSNRSWR